jgi:hypothetical protein
VDAFAADCAARGAGAGNARRIRHHLTPTLAARPVGLLTARELGGGVMGCWPAA